MPWENGSALSPPHSLKHMQKCKQLSHIPPEPPTRSPGTRVPPNPFPSLCQAQAAPTAHQQGRAFIPPLPRTGGRQGTYHSAKPRKQQAALTISMCAQRPLINSFFFFPSLPSALLWATKSNSAELGACNDAATHLSDPRLDPWLILQR